MLSLLLAAQLTLSIGTGYAITKDFSSDPENLRGLVRVEYTFTVQGDEGKDTLRVGWFHNSGLDNGFEGAQGDRDTVYLMVDIPVGGK